jgi:hypothetical protein
MLKLPSFRRTRGETALTLVQLLEERLKALGVAGDDGS